MNESYRIDPKMSLQEVVLKVNNLDKLGVFYERLGLIRLTETFEKIVFGVRGSSQPLLILKKVKDPNPRRKVSGLFHTAFLLPSRKDLGNVLYHLLSSNVPVEGASDHGFSEAIYLQDPEGNGIEIYRDKPKEQWDIRPGGRIAGITIQMDADGVLASRDQVPVAAFPENTVVGHVHLSVSDLNETQNFYLSVLGFELKDQYGDQARFFAANGYHHHIGTNIWLGKNIAQPEKDDFGLESFTLHLSTAEEWTNLKNQLQMKGISIFEEHAKRFVITDPNGIKLKITYETGQEN